MKVKWNGHASFTITAGDGKVIVTDPYESGAFEGNVAYESVCDRADVVLVSHDHADHNCVSSIPGSPEVLKAGGSAGDMDFTGVTAAHDDKGGAERGSNVVFVFEVDGVRVAHLGDLGHLLTDEQLEAMGRVDLLLVPVGGVFTVDPEAASKVVEQVKPRLVIPMHFKTGKIGFPLQGVDEFAQRMTNVKKTGKSEVEIEEEDLPASGPEVWILEHAM